MVERTLLLDKIENVKLFVQFALMQEYKITLSQGEKNVNAKVIMSVFKLDLTRPVKMLAECEESEDFIRAIEKFRD